MKNRFVIGFLLWGNCCFTQTNIYIISAGYSKADAYPNYTFKNKSDTSLIKINPRDISVEKFDMAPGEHPDGRYDVYLDDTLYFTGFIKNNRKDSVWTYYYKNGKMQARFPYKNGYRNGECTGYSKSGVMTSKFIWKNGSLQNEVGFEYYETGIIKKKWYFNEFGQTVKQEKFNAKGELTGTDIIDPNGGSSGGHWHHHY